MFSDDHTYTMEDLTRLTGFTARQIRYYITRKLAPAPASAGRTCGTGRPPSTVWC